MDDLTPAQLAVLRAAADAPSVRRPARPELRVGDTVAVSGGSTRSTHFEAVTKIGPKWVTVGADRAAKRFDRTTWRGTYGYGTGISICSPEQHAYDERMRVARNRLSDAGLRGAYLAEIADGRVLAIAALLDLLDER
jgi:hypothetical protein